MYLLIGCISTFNRLNTLYTTSTFHLCTDAFCCWASAPPGKVNNIWTRLSGSRKHICKFMKEKKIHSTTSLLMFKGWQFSLPTTLYLDLDLTLTLSLYLISSEHKLWIMMPHHLYFSLYTPSTTSNILPVTAVADKCFFIVLHATTKMKC